MISFMFLSNYFTLFSSEVALQGENNPLFQSSEGKIYPKAYK